jgi:hypothetical protein
MISYTEAPTIDFTHKLLDMPGNMTVDEEKPIFSSLHQSFILSYSDYSFFMPYCVNYSSSVHSYVYLTS